MAAQEATSSAPPSAAASRKPPASAHEHGIDGLIAHLHDTFKITPAQEPQWQAVAKIMRENAEALSSLTKTRADHADTTTALDDLKSYAEIAEAHASGTQRLIPAFEALYVGMSAAQKQAADAEFRDHFREHHR